MVKRSDAFDYLEAALGEAINVVDDPQDRGWLTGSMGSGIIHLRMGNFPEEEM